MKSFSALTTSVKMSSFRLKIVKSEFKPSGSYRSVLIFGFYSIKRLGVLLLSPG